MISYLKTILSHVWLSSLIAALACGIVSCQLHDLTQPGKVLLATTDQDNTLPQLRITVAGKSRSVHLRAFGDSTKPPLLFMHGSLGDHRVWLPYAALADKYYVIMWDQRGNGLSERISESEIGADLVLDEINAISQQLAPGKKITIVGHSFGAMYSAYYLAKYGNRVEQAVLIEPAGINIASMQEAMKRSFRLDLFSGSYAARMQQIASFGATDHERLDLAALQLLYSDEMQYHCDVANKVPMPIWRPGGFLDLVRSSQMMNSAGIMEFDFTQGLENYQDTVLLMGGTCSGIGQAYQEQIIAPFFKASKVVTIDGTGHRLIAEKPTLILNHLRQWLHYTR